ncbi:MAG: hypothetical protein JST75_09655 [Bacteroidetes bacterium]|nr:hypothetical protein [Bacteroidota bacterium]
MSSQRTERLNYKSDLPDNKKIWIAISLAALVFFLIIANPSKYYFLNDDFGLIPISAEKHFIHGYFFRLLFNISLWFDHLIWGRTALGYHLTNVIIHIVNSILLFLFAQSLFILYHDNNTLLKSWLASVLFLLYAFHSESIFWIAGRGGSLSSLFFLSAGICYLKRDHRRLNIFLSVFFFICGLFVYESVWIFPFFCFAISATDVLTKKKDRKRESRYIIFVISAFLFYFIYRRMITGKLSTDYELGSIVHLNVSALFYNYNTLIARSFLPPMASSKLFLASYLLGIAVSLVILFALIKKRKMNVLTWLLIICFMISILPPVSLGIDTHDTESERFIYLSSIFAILLIIEVLSLLLNARKFFICSILLMIAHGFYLFQSALVYRFSGSITRKSLEFINQKQELENIYLVNLPSQYKGALMFRSGLTGAIQWICTDCKYGHLVTLNAHEFTKRKKTFQLLELKGERGIKSMNGKLIVDSAGSNSKIELSHVSFSFRPGKDMILYWTDSSLVKIK